MITLQEVLEVPLRLERRPLLAERLNRREGSGARPLSGRLRHSEPPRQEEEEEGSGHRPRLVEQPSLPAASLAAAGQTHQHLAPWVAVAPLLEVLAVLKVNSDRELAIPIQYQKTILFAGATFGSVAPSGGGGAGFGSFGGAAAGSQPGSVFGGGSASSPQAPKAPSFSSWR